MTVKTIKEQVTVNRQIYVANDGKEFVNHSECARYEEELKHKQKFLIIANIECNEAMDGKFPFDGEEYVSDHDYRWYKPKTKEEISILNTLFRIDKYKDCLSVKDIGKWICIEKYDFEDTWEDCYLARLENSIEHIKRFLNGFGYDVTITERE